ncbi:vascular endothelial growth factor receptor 1 [Folsomia candida]|uniref:vascular endothelial growth factor receptor 1 n=1 Tax=Folsomia candida TaxID=158441 RepID=UPI0016052562|nr:vascular endothelial growth factor receptor 1 [Folsomia candida]
MLSNIKVVELLLYIHMILLPAISIVCAVQNETLPLKHKSLGITYALIVSLGVIGFGNILAVLVWRRSERFVYFYQVFFFIIPPIFWALLNYPILSEKHIPTKLGLIPAFHFLFCLTFMNCGILLGIYQDLLRTNVGYPPASRRIGVHVTKLIRLHFWAHFGYTVMSLALVISAQFTRTFYEFLPFTIPIFLSELMRLIFWCMFYKAYQLKSSKPIARLVFVTYTNDVIGKGIQFVADYHRQIVLAKPSGFSDKLGITFPLQLFVFIFFYRLWFVFINYFKRRSESVEMDHFHRSFEKFMTETKIPVIKVKCDQSDATFLGGGFFGKVYKAEMIHPRDEIVAVKFITDFKSVLKDATALEKELQILTFLSSHGNPNLVGFHGIAWHFSNFTYQVGIVLQYCAGGMVTQYLDGIRYQDSFPWNVKPEMFKTLDKWSLQIVNAMKYLESRNIIHGDLAARNVLLDGHQNAKLADFGMSLKLYQYQEYALPGQTVFPWRYMALEVLQDLKFSAKSDVWSFGVLLWELYTFGETPWAGMEWNADFVTQLTNGRVLRAPEFARQIYNEVMLPCWNADPGERPSFAKLETLLSQGNMDSSSVLT